MDEMSKEDWEAGHPCPEDNIVRCHRCKPKDLPGTVYRSSNSSSFHRTPDCEGLAAGQRKVAERGQEPSAIIDVYREKAIADGLMPCYTCFPDHKKRV